MGNHKYNRIFTIVLDSVGMGAMEDSPRFGDVGVDTLGHISGCMAEAGEPFALPNLQKLGLETKKPFITFTDTGFPGELIHELEQRCEG